MDSFCYSLSELDLKKASFCPYIVELKRGNNELPVARDLHVTRLRLSQQVSFEGYFLQVSHILAAVFPQVADKPYIGANCITLYVFSSAMITWGD